MIVSFDLSLIKNKQFGIKCTNIQIKESGEVFLNRQTKVNILLIFIKTKLI